MVVKYIRHSSKIIKGLSYNTLEILLDPRTRKTISENNQSRIIATIMSFIKEQLKTTCKTHTLKLLQLIISYYGHQTIPTSEYLCDILFKQLEGILQKSYDKEFNYSLFRTLGELMKLCSCYSITFFQWEQNFKPLLISCLSKPELAGYSFQLLAMILKTFEDGEHNVIH